MTQTLSNTLSNTLSRALLLLALGLAASASAASTHAWVSHAGADTGGCTRAAPCLTFAYALSQTQSGGTISAVDAGDYGPVTIDRAVTLDGEGTQAAISVATGAAITINAPNGAAVTLRHLTLSGTGGANGGQTGIAYNAGGPIAVEECRVANFAADGFDLAGPGPALVTASTFTSNAQMGVYVGSGPMEQGPALTSLRDVTISGSSIGLYTCSGTTDISHSLVTQNTTSGLLHYYGIFADMGSTITVSNCVVSGNTIALRAAPGCLLRLSNDDIWNNGVGIDNTGNQNEPGAGTYSTAGNNRKAGNTTSGAPTPGRIITVQ